jgi:hypothetical protein
MFDDWYKERTTADHWNEDRSEYLLFEFADDDVKEQAMRYFLRLWENWDADRLVELFDCLSREKQTELLTDYIDGHDDAQNAFNSWYNERNYGPDIDLDYEYEYALEHGWRD